MANTKVLLGFIAGAAAGAIAGILLAPEKGSVTIDNLFPKRDRLDEDIDDGIDEFKGGVRKAASKIKTGTDNLKNDAEDALDSWKNKTHESML